MIPTPFIEDSDEQGNQIDGATTTKTNPKLGAKFFEQNSSKPSKNGLSNLEE
jgi:hypothetical protein